MRNHPYVRTAFAGLVVGVAVGAAFYGVLRLFGTHANTYLLVAIVVAFIPGSVMLSELIESDQLEKAEDQERPDEDPQPSPGPSPRA
jgi:hypothetical protein